MEFEKTLSFSIKARARTMPLIQWLRLSVSDIYDEEQVKKAADFWTEANKPKTK